MTNQRAIQILAQYDVSDLHFYTTDGEEIPFQEWSDAIEMAISALIRQIPMRIRTKREHSGYGYASYCPNCKRMDVGGWSYCPDCGQSIVIEAEGE